MSDEKRVLYTNEGGGLVSLWNHLISIEADEKGGCVYTDEVDIEAGFMTVPVALYAQLFYRKRH